MMQLYDPWDYQFIKKNPNKHLGIWSDLEAWQKLKGLRWVYDKLKIHERYNQKRVYDLELEWPRRYPVFVKPRRNLYGMGKEAYIAYSKEDIKWREGMIAQYYFKGKQTSTDFVKYKGVVVDHFSFISYKDKNGSLVLFESTDDICPLASEIARDIPLRDGFINIECIDENVLEVHLRPSLQFYDVSGGLMPKYLSQRAKDVPRSRYVPSQFEKTYSRVIRRRTDVKYRLPHAFPRKPPGIRSIQFCWEKGDWLGEWDQDEFSFRVMIVNGDNLQNINTYGDRIYNNLKILDNRPKSC